jgi:hypothetical protein
MLCLRMRLPSYSGKAMVLIDVGSDVSLVLGRPHLSLPTGDS